MQRASGVGAVEIDEQALARVALIDGEPDDGLNPGVVQRGLGPEEGGDGEIAERLARGDPEDLGALLRESMRFVAIEPELIDGVRVKIDEIAGAEHRRRDEDRELLSECLFGALGFAIGEEPLDDGLMRVEHIARVAVGDAPNRRISAWIEEVWRSLFRGHP